MTNPNKLADALRDMLSGWTYIRQRYGDLDGVGWGRAEDAATAALAEHDASEECFCDRMYPDSNPNASCGDCPTRDYAPQPAPGEWVMVPREPTDAMTLAGKHFVKGSEGLFERGIAIGVWEIMLAAAPQPSPCNRRAAMTGLTLEQRARELLAAESERDGYTYAAWRIRKGEADKEAPMRAIKTALQQAQQPGAQAVALTKPIAA